MKVALDYLSAHDDWQTILKQRNELVKNLAIRVCSQF
jgi:hypothetical protein